MSLASIQASLAAAGWSPYSGYMDLTGGIGGDPTTVNGTTGSIDSAAWAAQLGYTGPAGATGVGTGPAPLGQQFSGGGFNDPTSGQLSDTADFTNWFNNQGLTEEYKTNGLDVTAGLFNSSGQEVGSPVTQQMGDQVSAIWQQLAPLAGPAIAYGGEALAGAGAATTGTTAADVSAGTYGAGAASTAPELGGGLSGGGALDATGAGTVAGGSGSIAGGLTPGSSYLTSGMAGAGTAAGGSTLGAAAGGVASGGVSSYLSAALQIYNAYKGITGGNAVNSAGAAITAQHTGYANMLQALMNNPSSITSTPGYQAGLDQATQTLTRQLASQGLTGSGTAAAAIANEGAQYENQQFTQQEQILGQLSGLSAPGSAATGLQAQAGGTTTLSQSLASLAPLFSSNSSVGTQAVNGVGSAITNSGWYSSLFGG